MPPRRLSHTQSETVLDVNHEYSYIDDLPITQSKSSSALHRYRPPRPPPPKFHSPSPNKPATTRRTTATTKRTTTTTQRTTATTQHTTATTQRTDRFSAKPNRKVIQLGPRNSAPSLSTSKEHSRWHKDNH